MKDLLYEPPTDFAEPNWERCERAHEWKNYAYEDLIAIWPTLDLRTRSIIAANLQATANRESWD